MLRTHYSVLEVHREMEPTEIRDRFRVLALQHHPDRVAFASDADYHANKFIELSQAYGVLKNASAKRKYDMLLDLKNKKCSSCKGKGALKRTKGFTNVVMHRCESCGGSGVVTN